MSELPVMVALGDDYPELREAVHKICERYPGEYWRKLEAEQAYPTEFITELTQGGFLALLLPEEYGGSELPLCTAAPSIHFTNLISPSRVKQPMLSPIAISNLS